MADSNASFAGSIPEIYDRCLGPLLFEPSAKEFLRRSKWSDRTEVLELAAGTGILTRHLRGALPPTTRYTVTDLNGDMLGIARARYRELPITWKEADAQALPFERATFDGVACQYGVMFFPDKAAACKEIRRVLRPGGLFAFSVWDTLASNPGAAIARETIDQYFTSDRPTFYDVPFGFADEKSWTAWLTDAGFGQVHAETIPMIGEAPNAQVVAEGYILGNPVVLAIRERATASAEAVVAETAKRLAARYGAGPVRIPMQAKLFTALAR